MTHRSVSIFLFLFSFFLFSRPPPPPVVDRPPTYVYRPLSIGRFLPDSYLFIHVSALTCSTRSLAPNERFSNVSPTTLPPISIQIRPHTLRYSPAILLSYSPRLSAFPFATCMPTLSLSALRPNVRFVQPFAFSPSLTCLSSPEDRSAPPWRTRVHKHHLRRPCDSTCALHRDKARFKLRLRVGAFQLARSSPKSQALSLSFSLPPRYTLPLPLYNDFPPPPPPFPSPDVSLSAIIDCVPRERTRASRFRETRCPRERRTTKKEKEEKNRWIKRERIKTARGEENHGDTMAALCAA